MLLAAFGVTIAVSLVYGMQRGGRNFFFDWRALALGVAFYFIYRFWIQSTSDARAAIVAFCIAAGIRMADLVFSYMRGQGDSLLGMRIPLFDGPSISALVLAALLGLSIVAGAPSSRRRCLPTDLQRGSPCCWWRCVSVAPTGPNSSSALYCSQYFRRAGASAFSLCHSVSRSSPSLPWVDRLPTASPALISRKMTRLTARTTPTTLAICWMHGTRSRPLL